MDGKVLRHALVKVSMGPGPLNDSQEELKQDKVEEDISDDENLTND